MATAFLIGRIIFGVYWLMSAYEHLFRHGNMISYAESKGIKSPKFAIVGSGILLLLGGLAIIFGAFVKVGLALLIIFLVGVTFKMHDFWNATDPAARMGDEVNFYKNIALAAALLMLYAVPAPWDFSLGWGW